MRYKLNTFLAIIVYITLNVYIDFALTTHALVSFCIVVYFTIFYLAENNKDLLQKMIDNMKKVK
jgi:hypothetical protein